MNGAFSSTTTSLHILVTSTARSIAVALDSQLKDHYSSHNRTAGHETLIANKLEPPSTCKCSPAYALRKLREYFITLHTEEYHVGQCLTNSVGEDHRDFLRHLEEIASCLDRVIDSEYVSKFCPQDCVRDLHVKQLYHILQDPPAAFEDHRILRETVASQSSRLKLSLKWILDFVDNAMLSDLSVNPTLCVPPVPSQLHQGSITVRNLATRLHNSLHEEWPCNIEHDAEHVGKLGECTSANVRLDPRWLKYGAEDAAFLVVLSAGDTTYQECKIHMDTPRSFEDDEPLCLVDYNEESVKICRYLAIDDTDRLWHDSSEWLGLQLLTPSLPSASRYELMTLREILPSLRMSYMEKRCLQLVLARTILPLLAGPWMENHLAVYDISILCIVHEDQYDPQLNTVFLSSAFGDTSGPIRGSQYRHSFPAIESLGKLLAEIELSGQAHSVTQHKTSKTTVEELLAQCHGRIDTGGVLQAISFCIDPGSFKRHRPRKGVPGPKDADAFSALYYKHIIRPLEKDLVDGYGWTWELIDNSSLADIPSLADTKEFKQGQVSRAENHISLHTIKEETSTDMMHQLLEKERGASSPGAAYDPRSHVDSSYISARSNEWSERFEEMRTILDSARKEIRKSDVKNLIKVAVLDTGVDMRHSVFREWLKTGQLDAGLNLIDRDKPMVDTNGHGTHVCHVLLRTAPNIKLYPIRVLEGRQVDDHTASLVAEAIRYAVHECDVDIISMSFAFEEDEEVIEQAILHESNQKSKKEVLYFSAASNERALANEPIGFPARMKHHVICVFSSDLDDQPSTFSPKGIRSQPNFSAIGEDIEAAWITSKDDTNTLKTMSGTSFATPAVVGIAAILLDFVKEDREELYSLPGWIKGKRRLQGIEGMKSVLRRCMTDEEHTDGRYNILKPWKLLRGSNSVAIAVKIQDALDKRHK